MAALAGMVRGLAEESGVPIGVSRDLSVEPARVSFELEEPLTVAGEARRWLSVIHHCFDPEAGPNPDICTIRAGRAHPRPGGAPHPV